MDYSKYPTDWKEISLRIREREGWKCKWCGIGNKDYIIRTGPGRMDWRPATPEEILDRLKGYRVQGLAFIILTVAHLNHDTGDNSEANLAALCNKCHLNHDQKQHTTNAARTRHKKKVAAGQIDMFGEVLEGKVAAQK